MVRISVIEPTYCINIAIYGQVAMMLAMQTKSLDGQVKALTAEHSTE
jgi:hypothetical protein